MDSLLIGSYPFLITQNYQALILNWQMNEQEAESSNDEEYEVKPKRRRESSPQEEKIVFLDIKDKKFVLNLVKMSLK